MAKRRPSGDGMVRKREDGRWEGRIVVGHKKNGTPIFQHAYAHTQKELTEKLHQNLSLIHILVFVLHQLFCVRKILHQFCDELRLLWSMWKIGRAHV